MKEGTIGENMTSSGILLAWTSSKNYTDKLKEKLREILAEHVAREITSLDAIALMTIYEIGDVSVNEVRECFVKRMREGKQ